MFIYMHGLIVINTAWVFVCRNICVLVYECVCMYVWVCVFMRVFVCLCVCVAWLHSLRRARVHLCTLLEIFFLICKIITNLYMCVYASVCVWARCELYCLYACMSFFCVCACEYMWMWYLIKQNRNLTEGFKRNLWRNWNKHSSRAHSLRTKRKKSNFHLAMLYIHSQQERVIKRSKQSFLLFVQCISSLYLLVNPY